MASETIVAVFNSMSDAEAAISDLTRAGVPQKAIQHHARDASYAPADGETTGSTTSSPRQGFWGWLLGEENYQDHQSVYEHSIESGGVVVTAVIDEAVAPKIVSLIDAHNPVDLDERASAFNNSTAGTTESGGARAQVAPAQVPPAAAAATPMAATTTPSAKRPTSGLDSQGDQVLSLSEESLNVGKRSIDRGTARVRRYVVERPVEEQIRLRDESIRIERRPVTGNAALAPDAFTDKTIELQETSEEAVVSKTARVVDEVVIHKDVNERTETVRDTVRREEVEIDDPAKGGAATPRKPI